MTRHITPRNMRPTLALALVAALALALVAALPSRAADTAPLFWVEPPLPLAFEPRRISSVAFHDNASGFALASSGNAGEPIMRSIDGGLNWGRTTFEAPDSRFGYVVVQGAQRLRYFAFGGDRIATTGDGGSTWLPVPYDTSCNTIYSLAPHPIQSALIYATTANGLVRSDDGGQTWFAPEPNTDLGCSSGRTVQRVVPAYTGPDLVYATYADGVLRSTNRGASWADASAGLPTESDGTVGQPRQLIADLSNGDRLYAVAGGAVYTTANGGGQWSQLGQGLPAGEAGNLARALNGDLYAATTSAVYRLAVGASTWERVQAALIPQPSSSPAAPAIALDTSVAGRIVLYSDSGLYVGLPDNGRLYLPAVRER